MYAVDLSTFLGRRGQHRSSGPVTGHMIEIGAARMHYESQDSWAGTVSCCRDWRAEIRMSALDADADSPDIVVGTVNFLILRLGHEPVAEVLELFGEQAAAFAELFDDEWLAPDLDEHDDFTAGMPIGAALLILDATVDDRLPADLRPWAVSEVAHTMLPTTSGLVAMTSTQPTTSHLVSVDRLDRDWLRVGCAPVPGHPRFLARATAYTFLDDARAQLAAVRERTFRIEAH